MPFQLSRLPQTRDELYWYVRARYGVAIPRTPVCPDHVPPFVAFADAYFAVNSLDPDSPVTSLALWHGSRGLSGKSFMLSLLGTTLAELLGAEVNLLGGSLSQSMNIHTHINRALDYPEAPSYMVKLRSNTKIEFTNNAVVRPLTASQRTVRGPHPPRLLCDEIDEMDQEILDAALGQPLPQINYHGETVRPYTVMCSTWQHSQGTFTTTLRRCEEQRTPIYRWCYRESANPIDGWLTDDVVEEKRRSIPRAMWETEYELNEPAIGTRAFDMDAVEAAFDLPFAPIRQKRAKDFEEFVFAHPLRGAAYVATADWAKEKDYTVIAVGRVDVEPHELVYYLRVNRRPYPMMVDWYNSALRRYGAESLHDGTGLGNVINDYLDANARAFLMTGRDRDELLSEYVGAIESGTWHFPQVPSAYIAHKYCEVEDLYGRGNSHHLPDEVCAFALMERAARRYTGRVSPLVVAKSEPVREPPELSMGTGVRVLPRDSGYSLTV